MFYDGQYTQWSDGRRLCTAIHHTNVIAFKNALTRLTKLIVGGSYASIP